VRDDFNRGRRKKTLPDLTKAKVEFVSTKQHPLYPNRWMVTLYVNGWPHDIGVFAKDELDVMKQVLEMQRGRIPSDAFDISK